MNISITNGIAIFEDGGRCPLLGYFAGLSQQDRMLILEAAKENWKDFECEKKHETNVD